MANEEVYLNIPLAPEIKRELAVQADENARSTGREASVIIEREMKKRIAKREAAK